MPVKDATSSIKHTITESIAYLGSKKSETALLISSVALGILVTLAGIGLFSSSAPHWLTYAIGTIGNSGTGVFLFGGGILACAGGISSIILFVKSSGKKKESIEENDSQPTLNSAVKLLEEREEENKQTSQTMEVTKPETSGENVEGANSQQPTQTSGVKLAGTTYESELHIAVWKGRKSKVNKVLNKEGVDFNIFENGKTALHISIGLMKTKKDFAIFKTLVSNQKVNVNIPMKDDGTTPLHLAVQCNKIKAIEVLLTRDDINLDLKDTYDLSALDYAEEKGSKQIIQLLTAKNEQLRAQKNSV